MEYLDSLSELNDLIATKLKNIMVARNYTKAEFAHMLDISRPYLNNILRKDANITLYTLNQRLGCELEISFEAKD